MESELFSCENFWNEATKRLERQRIQELFVDVEIETKGGHVIKAHRNVLSAVFPRLERIMSSLTSNRLQWPRFDYDVVMVAVDFAYTGRVELTLDNAVRLLLLSVNLNCLTLRDWCIQFLASNGRISGENVSQIWAIANSISNEQLMMACVEVIRVELERLDRDFYTWSHTSARGMGLLLEADDNFTSKQALDFWIHLENSDNSPKKKLCSLIDNSNLEVLQFDTLLFVCLKTAELRVSQDYRDKIEGALRSGNLRNTSQAGPSTSRGASSITTSTNQLKSQVLAISELNSNTGSALMRNVPEFQDGPAIQQKLSYRNSCRYVIFKDWVCTLGGCYGNTYYSTFDIYNLKTSNQFQGPPMLQPRICFATAATSDCIFVFGGFCNGTIISSCEYYDSSCSSWISLPDLSYPRDNLSAIHVPGEGIIVVGGRFGGSVRTSFELRSTSNEMNVGDWFFQGLPDLLKPRQNPGITYHNGHVFVAGDAFSTHLDVESLKYPTMPDEAPQWTFVSLLEISPKPPFSLIELDGQLLFVNGDGQVLEYHEAAKSGSTVESQWKSKCRLENFSNSYIFIRYINT